LPWTPGNLSLANTSRNVGAGAGAAASKECSSKTLLKNANTQKTTKLFFLYRRRKGEIFLTNIELSMSNVTGVIYF
jgi:hypothetical protein